MRRAAATIVASRSGAVSVGLRAACCDPPATGASGGHVDELLQHRSGAAAVDRLGRHRDPFTESSARVPAMSSDARGVQQRRCRAARRRWPARTARAIAALSAASPPRSASGAALRQADVSRMQVERVHRAVAALRHLRVAGGRDLVEAVGAVHDPGALRAELGERTRDQLGQLRTRHADELSRRARRDWSAARAG